MSPDGFGDASNYAVTALEGHAGHLYAIIGHQAGAGSEVWRCKACDGIDWQQVVDNGFGHPATRGTPALEPFDGRLYAVVGNASTGLEVWRSGNGTAWEQVGFAGFGRSANRSPYWDQSVAVFGGRLFVGTVNWSGAEVWMYLHRSLYLPLVVRGS